MEKRTLIHPQLQTELDKLTGTKGEIIFDSGCRYHVSLAEWELLKDDTEDYGIFYPIKVGKK